MLLLQGQQQTVEVSALKSALLDQFRMLHS